MAKYFYILYIIKKSLTNCYFFFFQNYMKILNTHKNVVLKVGIRPTAINLMVRTCKESTFLFLADFVRPQDNKQECCVISKRVHFVTINHLRNCFTWGRQHSFSGFAMVGSDEGQKRTSPNHAILRVWCGNTFNSPSLLFYVAINLS